MIRGEDVKRWTSRSGTIDGVSPVPPTNNDEYFHEPRIDSVANVMILHGHVHFSLTNRSRDHMIINPYEGNSEEVLKSYYPLG